MTIQSKIFFKGLSALILLTSCFACTEKQPSCQLTMQLHGISDTTTFSIITQSDESVSKQFIKIGKNGKLEASIQTTQLQTIVVAWDNNKKFFPIHCTPEGNHYIVEGDANFPELLSVKGGSTNDSLNVFKQRNASLLQEFIKQRYRVIEAKKEIQSLKADSLNNDSTFRNTTLKVYQAVTEFITLHPDDITSLLLIRDFCTQQVLPNELQTMLVFIGNSLRTNHLYLSLLQFVRRELGGSIGSDVPNMLWKTIKGDTISTRGQRGKYLLIEFWASWCPSCRTEIPYLKNTYKEFKGKNFELIGISLDDEKSTWTKAVEQDSLTWPQVCELKGFRSNIADSMGVVFIPENYLIDPHGKIIAKDLRGDSLINTLKRLIK